MRMQKIVMQKKKTLARTLLLHTITYKWERTREAMRERVRVCERVGGDSENHERPMRSRSGTHTAIAAAAVSTCLVAGAGQVESLFLALRSFRLLL